MHLKFNCHFSVASQNEQMQMQILLYCCCCCCCCHCGCCSAKYRQIIFIFIYICVYEWMCIDEVCARARLLTRVGPRVRGAQVAFTWNVRTNVITQHSLNDIHWLSIWNSFLCVWRYLSAAAAFLCVSSLHILVFMYVYSEVCFDDSFIFFVVSI